MLYFLHCGTTALVVSTHQRANYANGGNGIALSTALTIIRAFLRCDNLMPRLDIDLIGNLYDMTNRAANCGTEFVC